jgi:hypothetical protein
MSTIFRYQVNINNGAGNLTIYNNRIVIDPTMSGYQPQPGTLSGNILTVTFNLPLSSSDNTLLNNIVFNIFLGINFDSPRVSTSTSSKPGSNHDMYLGYCCGSTWFDINNMSVYYCYDGTPGLAKWSTNSSSYAFSVSIPNATKIICNSNTLLPITQWSTSPDYSLYSNVNTDLSNGIFSPQKLGGYRFSLIFQIECQLNVTDIIMLQIRRNNVPIRQYYITTCQTHGQSSFATNIGHNIITDKYQVVIQNNSPTNINYTSSSYILYNWSVEYLD